MADEVRNNTAQHRFELEAEGGTAFAYYTLSPGVITFTHTEVFPGSEGMGVGRGLARGALDDVRRRGLKLIAECEFIAGFLKRHPEDRDLIAS